MGIWIRPEAEDWNVAGTGKDGPPQADKTRPARPGQTFVHASPIPVTQNGPGIYTGAVVIRALYGYPFFSFSPSMILRGFMGVS